jgi:hypothetical protein
MPVPDKRLGFGVEDLIPSLYLEGSNFKPKARQPSLPGQPDSFIPGEEVQPSPSSLATDAIPPRADRSPFDLSSAAPIPSAEVAFFHRERSGKRKGLWNYLSRRLPQKEKVRKAKSRRDQLLIYIGSHMFLITLLGLCRDSIAIE